MTTIVAINNKKERAIYADSRVTQGNVLASENCLKVRKVSTPKGEALVGFCGSLELLEKNLKLIQEGKTEELTLQDSEVVVLYDSGPIVLYTDEGYINWDESTYCTGSGGIFAQVALGMGLSPQDAIKEASKYDLCTNNKVKVKRL